MPNPTISNNRRRLLTTSTAPVPLSTASSLLKRTRFSPDLTLCHSCNLRFPSNTNSSRHRLRLLRSRWRIALLCRNCLSSVAASRRCSYCFSPFSNPPSSPNDLTCHSCTRTVHLPCALRENRSVPPQSLEPDRFVCIDCYFVPGFRPRVRVSNLKAGVCFNDVAAVNEGDKAGPEIDGVKGAEEDRIGGDGESKFVGEVGLGVRDEEVALKLHLSMNGSSRITRNSRQLEDGKAADGAVSQCSDVVTMVEGGGRDDGCHVLADVVVLENGKKAENDGNVEYGEDQRGEVRVEEEKGNFSDKGEIQVEEEKGNCSDKGKVQVEEEKGHCSDEGEIQVEEVKGNCLDKGEVQVEGEKGNCSDKWEVQVEEEKGNCSDKGEVQVEEEKSNCSDKGEVRVEEEKGNCSDDVLNLQDLYYEIDSFVVYKRKKVKFSDKIVDLENHEGDGEHASLELQIQDINSIPDRYMKTYCKRPPKPKEEVDVLRTPGDDYMKTYCKRPPKPKEDVDILKALEDGYMKKYYKRPPKPKEEVDVLRTPGDGYIACNRGSVDFSA